MIREKYYCTSPRCPCWLLPSLARMSCLVDAPLVGLARHGYGSKSDETTRSRSSRTAQLSSRLLRVVSLITLLATVAQAGGARAAISSLNHLFVFGDSLSDNGNSGVLTNGAFPPPPDAQNRYTNGNVAVDYL